MWTKNIIVAIPTVVIILGFVFLPWTNNYLGILIEPALPKDWKEVYPRNIVKNSIPVTILKQDANSCLISAKNLENIIDHKYFENCDEFTSQIMLNSDGQTIGVSCDILHGDTSELNIWHVTEVHETCRKV